MPRRRSSKVLAAALVIAALAGAVAAALVSDDDGGKAGSATAPAPSPATPTATGTTSETTATATAPSRPPRRERRAIERTVTDLVTATEQGDGAAFCRLVGEPSAGGGLDALEGCAGAAGVDLTSLPTSDELSVESVRVSGDRASARLANGAVVSLRKTRAGWRVQGARLTTP